MSKQEQLHAALGSRQVASYCLQAMAKQRCMHVLSWPGAAAQTVSRAAANSVISHAGAAGWLSARERDGDASLGALAERAP